MYVAIYPCPIESGYTVTDQHACPSGLFFAFEIKLEYLTII